MTVEIIEAAASNLINTVCVFFIVLFCYANVAAVFFVIEQRRWKFLYSLFVYVLLFPSCMPFSFYHCASELFFYVKIT